MRDGEKKEGAASSLSRTSTGRHEGGMKQAQTKESCTHKPRRPLKAGRGGGSPT